MPRIIVTTDAVPDPTSAQVLLDEHVETVHLATDHAAAQLVERIAWAISDADDAESRSRPQAGGTRRASVSPSRLGRARYAGRRPAVALLGRPA
jgi:hypothetical protein